MTALWSRSSSDARPAPICAWPMKPRSSSTPAIGRPRRGGGSRSKLGRATMPRDGAIIFGDLIGI